MSGADIAQPVERILGKDEVPGPNPGISSTIKARKCVVCGLCYFLPAILIFKKPLQKPQRGINFSRAGYSHSAFLLSIDFQLTGFLQGSRLVALQSHSSDCIPVK